MNSPFFLGLAAAGVTAIGTIAAFVYAATKHKRFRSPARWFMLGLFMWIVAGISSHVVTIFLANTRAPVDLGRYSLIISFVRSCVDAAGLLFIVHAVFVDREKGTDDAGPQKEFASDDRPPSNNPFSAPRSV